MKFAKITTFPLNGATIYYFRNFDKHSFQVSSYTEAIEKKALALKVFGKAIQKFKSFYYLNEGGEKVFI